MVEVEVRIGKAAAVQPPAWFGRELTSDREWANQSLAVRGLPSKRDEFRLRAGGPGPIRRVISAQAAQAAAAVRPGRRPDSATPVHEARRA